MEAVMAGSTMLLPTRGNDLANAKKNGAGAPFLSGADWLHRQTTISLARKTLKEAQLAKCHANAFLLTPNALAKDGRAVGHEQCKENWDVVSVRQSEPCTGFRHVDDLAR
jgi:hypothetical protein